MDREVFAKCFSNLVLNLNRDQLLTLSKPDKKSKKSQILFRRCQVAVHQSMSWVSHEVTRMLVSCVTGGIFQSASGLNVARTSCLLLCSITCENQAVCYHRQSIMVELITVDLHQWVHTDTGDGGIRIQVA